MVCTTMPSYWVLFLRSWLQVLRLSIFFDLGLANTAKQADQGASGTLSLHWDYKIVPPHTFLYGCWGSDRGPCAHIEAFTNLCPQPRWPFSFMLVSDSGQTFILPLKGSITRLGLPRDLISISNSPPSRTCLTAHVKMLEKLTQHKL